MKFYLFVLVLAVIAALISSTNGQLAEKCKLSKEVGPCRGSKPNFYYNTETKACEQFLYGGCQGNENNFKSIEECQTACKE